MRGGRIAIGLRAALAICAVFLFVTGTRAASQEKALHSATARTALPAGRLVLDAAGNLYGTTSEGGIYHCDMFVSPSIHCGTAFELTSVKGGGWTKKVLHSFGNGADGTGPNGGLILDAAGNLYGTTGSGGTYPSACMYGCGTVFELTPTKGGGWTEKVLHSFGERAGGQRPNGDLILDAAGNLYGTTCLGGAYDNGTVFELSPTKDGGWTEKVIHSFNHSGSDTDGTCPSAGVIFDAAGNLYGTTVEGGEGDCYGGTDNACGGTVFELTPTKDGEWFEKVLHNFGEGKDGANPAGDLIFDRAGNLYGTTPNGGAYKCGTWSGLYKKGDDYYFGPIDVLGPCTDGYGTVFELSPTKDGEWTEKVLHSFGKGQEESPDVPANWGWTPPPPSKGADVRNPDGGLVFDAAENLYGTASGAVFELTPAQSGVWTEKLLHSFGNIPKGVLIIDAAGNLYRTTALAGARGYVTIFWLKPKAGGDAKEKAELKTQSASPEGSPGPARPANKTAHPAKSAGIRSVDFLNFDYPNNCNGSGEVIHVSNGDWEKAVPDQPSTDTPMADYFWAASPIYGDLKGDGQEEAVVHTTCGVKPSPNYGEELLVFEMSSKGPQLLAELLPLDWAQGDEAQPYFATYLEWFRIRDRKLILSFSVTAEFVWDGERFTRNDNVALNIVSNDRYTLAPERDKWPELSVACTQKDGKTEHHLIFSPDGLVVGYTPKLVAKGGQATFKMTIGGAKQDTAWFPQVEKGEVKTVWFTKVPPKVPYDVVNFTYLGTEAERWKFIQSLLNSGSVSIEFTPVNGKPVTSVFDVSRLREGIGKHPQCAAK